ncbi:hypothetical protein [Paenibacillus herberti]|uniref:Uncharacterized protein n=1 Tax=Paenibacillus herberti TaxID=1619309 RepID=A0A229NVN2_9BACL|nr:hypothetical protein [Paenibacillus herberti]OXM13689.1 hypothetical protein CGZ75_21970 [Paenibacillus herberti]
MQLGLVLVLFILLVIVTSVFGCNSLEAEEDVSIAASKGFVLQNRTSDYTFVSTAFSGDFESPGPSPNTVSPGGNYRFEVVAKFFYQTTTAVAQYVVYSTGGNRIGTLSLTFETRNSGIDWRVYIGRPSSIIGDTNLYNGAVNVILRDNPPSL